MSTQPIPIDVLAKSLRQKYPGSKFDKMSDAQIANYVVTQHPETRSQIASYAETGFEKERNNPNKPGFTGTFSDRMSQLWSGLKGMNPVHMTTPDQQRSQQQAEDEAGYAEQRQLAQNRAGRVQQGRSLPYRMAAAAGETSGVANPSASERSADIGDTGGVLGNAAADLAPVAATELVGRGVPAARRAIARQVYDPTTGAMKFPNATTLAQRVVAGPDPYAPARGAQEIRAAQAEMNNDIAQGRQQRGAAYNEMEQAQLAPRRAAGPDYPTERQWAQSRQAPIDQTLAGPPAQGPSVPKGGLPDEAAASPVVRPTLSRRVGEGRPATWPTDVVNTLGSWGDPEGAAQVSARMSGPPESPGAMPPQFKAPIEGYPERGSTLLERLQQQRQPAPPESSPVPSYRPSEKATTLSQRTASRGPEWDAAQRQEMIDRYKGIQRNPNATSDDLAEANARLKELGAVQ